MSDTKKMLEEVRDRTLAAGEALGATIDRMLADYLDDVDEDDDGTDIKDLRKLRGGDA